MFIRSIYFIYTRFIDINCDDLNILNTGNLSNNEIFLTVTEPNRTHDG